MVIPDFEDFHDLLRWRDRQLDALEAGQMSRAAYRRLIREAARQYEADARARMEERESNEVEASRRASRA